MCLQIGIDCVCVKNALVSWRYTGKTLDLSSVMRASFLTGFSGDVCSLGTRVLLRTPEQVRERVCVTLFPDGPSLLFSECMIHNQRLFMRERENRWRKRVILIYLLQIAQFSKGQSKYTETLKTQNQYLSQTAQLHSASTCMTCYSAQHLFKKPWLENTSKSLHSVQF